MPLKKHAINKAEQYVLCVLKKSVGNDVTLIKKLLMPPFLFSDEQKLTKHQSNSIRLLQKHCSQQSTVMGFNLAWALF